jgi:hypothetical protein
MSEVQDIYGYNAAGRAAIIDAIKDKHPTATTRLVNCCVLEGYSSLEEWAKHPDHVIYRSPNIGRKSIAELRMLTGTSNDDAVRKVAALFHALTPIQQWRVLDYIGAQVKQ